MNKLSLLPLPAIGAVLLWCGPQLLAAETTLHSAIDPQPRPDQGWKDRQAAINQRVAEVGEKAEVIFIGDSITQGWEGAGKQVWARYYAGRNALNLGIGGDRTQHVLWRLDHGNLNGLKPKAAVVMIGTNNSNGEDNTPGQIVDGVTAIVNKLREKLPDMKVLLVAIFPRGENYNPQRGKILQVNQVLRKLADNRSIYWVDFGYQFVNPDGLIPRQLMPDYLHLTPKGYAIWAEAIERRLSSILGDTRIEPAAESTASLSGEWAWTMNGPNGNPVEGTLTLKQEGESLTGKISRGENRWLDIENGKVNGNEFSWTIKRDRPNGGTMTYNMSGKLEGDKLTGVTKVQIEGEERSSEWSARRK